MGKSTYAIPKDGTFDTGMRFDEAMRRAETWWNEFRGAVPREFDRENTVRTSTSSAGPMFRFLADNEVTGDSILNGRAWAELTNEEQQKICIIWHHFQIRVPFQASLVPGTDTAIIH